MATTKTCVVVGAGPGNGLSLGRKFVEEGYGVAMLARNADNLNNLKTALPEAHTYECDVTQVSSIHGAFNEVRKNLGSIDILIYNAGSGVFGTVDDIDVQSFEQAWRVNAMGCFNCVKAVLDDMRAAGSGKIFVIGATAAKRGGSRFAAFASAKAAQYNLVQSLARHLGPENIHVAYIVIDGVIDIPRTRQRLPDKPDEFFLNPDHIAATVFQLTQQSPSAWTFELDIRPYCEIW